MEKKIINFFATKSDIKQVLQFVEAEQKIKYIECGLFFENIEKAYHSWNALPNLGTALKGDINFEPFYLIVETGTDITIRQVLQKNGDIKYAIDQGKNPQSIVFRPGGFHQESGILIAGQVGTISDHTFSNNLFNLFSKKIKKLFEKIQSFYVGIEASQLLENGVRLTSNIKSPILYDLKRK